MPTTALISRCCTISASCTSKQQGAEEKTEHLQASKCWYQRHAHQTLEISRCCTISASCIGRNSKNAVMLGAHQQFSI
jgi:hypothetical protein